jgi:hypothetical protein
VDWVKVMLTHQFYSRSRDWYPATVREETGGLIRFRQITCWDRNSGKEIIGNESSRKNGHTPKKISILRQTENDLPCKSWWCYWWLLFTFESKKQPGLNQWIMPWKISLVVQKCSESTNIDRNYADLGLQENINLSEQVLHKAVACKRPLTTK